MSYFSHDGNVVVLDKYREKQRSITDREQREEHTTERRQTSYQQRLEILRTGAWEIVAKCLTVTPGKRRTYIEKCLIFPYEVEQPRKVFGLVYPPEPEIRRPLLVDFFKDVITPFIARHYEDLEDQRDEFVRYVTLPKTRGRYNEDIVQLEKKVQRQPGSKKDWDALNAAEGFLTEDIFRTYARLIKQHVEYRNHSNPKHQF
jgi:hypothetical protein